MDLFWSLASKQNPCQANQKDNGPIRMAPDFHRIRLTSSVPVNVEWSFRVMLGIIQNTHRVFTVFSCKRCSLPNPCNSSALDNHGSRTVLNSQVLSATASAHHWYFHKSVMLIPNLVLIPIRNDASPGSPDADGEAWSGEGAKGTTQCPLSLHRYNVVPQSKYDGVNKWGYPHSWMIYKGKSH